MANTYVHILTKHEYKMTRCQDGIILLFPIEGQLKLQHFTKTVSVENDIYVINNTDIFSIIENKKTLMLYIASDWFRDRGFEFFNYKYSTNLVKSTSAIKRLLLHIALNALNVDAISDDTTHITSIVDIIGKEGAIEKMIANHQYNFSYYGELSDVLEYINQNINKKITLTGIASQLFTSKSNLSAQFNQLLNMGFKTYVDTLKIANSFEWLLTTENTISLISEKVGFSNASSYSKSFKNHVGMTPNEYRYCDKFNKTIYMDYETLNDTSLKDIRHLIKTKQQYYNQHDEHKIYADATVGSVVNPYYLVIQVNTIEEIRLLFLQDFARPLSFGKTTLKFYLNVDMRDIKDQMTKNERQRLFEYIIRNGLNVVFRLEDLGLTDFLESNYEDVADYFREHQLPTTGNHKLELVFDLEELNLKSIYRVILKIQHKTQQFSFGLEISKLLNDPVLFKTLESQIKRINFKFLYIDNAQLKMPYLIEQNEHLLVKNIVRYQNIRQILKQIDLENQKIIFLNFENHKFLNSKYNDLNNSAPLLIETFVRTASYFNGIGFDFKHHNRQFNALHIFDENGFKSILGTIVDQLLEISTKPKLLNENYILIDDEAHYTIFIYDWRVLENESLQVNYDQTDVFIDFNDGALKDTYLVKIQLIDDYNGNINHLISKHIRKKYKWSKRFLRKMDYHIHPTLKLVEHNFKKEPLQINLNYNALYVVKILKESRNNK
ncbi:helix-turn-helix transcriptional regulator [Staphylococcus borealis]|uniref:helix-turn-helix transcriptional regulator n=1 Tax=Staphylococcus borealis TaxID=2742203 RepID=UPI00374E8211